MAISLHVLILACVFATVGLAIYGLLQTRAGLPWPARPIPQRPVEAPVIPSLWFRFCYPLLNRVAPAVRESDWRAGAPGQRGRCSGQGSAGESRSITCSP